MDTAHALAKAGTPHGTIVAAERQHAGRGQHGRHWDDKGGKSLLCSFVLRAPDAAAHTLPLRAACAVHQLLHERFQLTAAIRWPNDILIRERKICGILSEFRNGVVVLGVGINCTQRASLRFTTLGATSIHIECARMGTQRHQNKRDLSPKRVLCHLAHRLLSAYSHAQWYSYLNRYLWQKGALVSITPASGAPFSAILVSVAEDGALLYMKCPFLHEDAHSTIPLLSRPAAPIEKLYAGSVRLVDIAMQGV